MTKDLNYGKWIEAEEVYLLHLIECYLRGILEEDVRHLTLRKFLASRLHCDPMRISKRLNENRYLLGRAIKSNFNRKSYFPIQDFTQLDIKRVNAMKEARNYFYVALSRKIKLRQGRTLRKMTKKFKVMQIAHVLCKKTRHKKSSSEDFKLCIGHILN
ncbi:hypothetical protein THRCLA_21634 [Thraustotheca clavata]|uniref:Uncharacterized protein n=1 Tax=Thraustotheca clavata TaxID=74557 RepID=A0A1V9ZT16_9STRA|nr:hypothetical protein THRCLA_21634 [Thraustotheca clavata]